MKEEGASDKHLQPVPNTSNRDLLPPALAGRLTPAAAEQIHQFYLSVADIFERWVHRRTSSHTQRAYRQDVMAFIQYLANYWPGGFKWPQESHRMLSVTLADVLGWRQSLLQAQAAPKTLNRRISSLSSFYKYLGAAAAEL